MKLHRNLLMIALALPVSGCMEVVSAEYANRDEAVARHAIGDSKWLPTWLPADAVSIRETHDIDTNASWLVFRPRTGVLVLPDDCRQTPRPEMPGEHVMRRFPAFARDAWARASRSHGPFYLCVGGASAHWVTHDGQMELVYAATTL